jgi:hypothetical protein
VGCLSLGFRGCRARQRGQGYWAPGSHGATAAVLLLQLVREQEAAAAAAAAAAAQLEDLEAELVDLRVGGSKAVAEARREAADAIRRAEEAATRHARDVLGTWAQFTRRRCQALGMAMACQSGRMILMRFGEPGKHAKQLWPSAGMARWSRIVTLSVAWKQPNSDLRGRAV